MRLVHYAIKFSLAAIALASLAIGGHAAAATLAVSPTKVELSNEVARSLIVLRNDGADTVRLQLDGVAWEQNEQGAVVTQPTTELVVFPTLMTLAPGETRQVRIGTTGKSESRERTFRLLVTELPPVESTARGLQMLTRLSIPVFLAPERVVESVGVGKSRRRGDHVVVDFENRGTAHVMLKSVSWVGRDARGAELAKGEAKGWYVLAGGAREVELELPAQYAGHITKIDLKSNLEGRTVEQTLVLSPSD